MHGDLVLIDIVKIRDDGRAEGRIVRPINRAHPTVVGIFHYGSRRDYVTPIDTKITQEIVIPEGMEHLGTEPGAPLLADFARSGDVSRTKQASHKKPGKKKSVDRVLGEEAARHENLNPNDGSISINNDCAIVLPAAVATAANGND